MISFDAIDSARRSTAGAALLAGCLHALRQLHRAWRNRRDFYRLRDMTDSELKDIGLTRADLYGAASGLAFGDDPTRRLRAIVEDRTDAS